MWKPYLSRCKEFTQSLKLNLHNLGVHVVEILRLIGENDAFLWSTANRARHKVVREELGGGAWLKRCFEPGRSRRRLG